MGEKEFKTLKPIILKEVIRKAKLAMVILPTHLKDARVMNKIRRETLSLSANLQILQNPFIFTDKYLRRVKSTKKVVLPISPFVQ